MITKEAFFDQLDAIVSATYESMLPLLADSAQELLGNSLQKKSGCFFQLLGFDVMLDRRGSAHLLEVRCNAVHAGMIAWCR